MNGTTAPAALACRNGYNAGGSKTDLFLPSRDELNELYKNKSLFSNWFIYSPLSVGNWYWSSSQSVFTHSAYYQSFNENSQSMMEKSLSCSVRAVRAF